MDWKLGDRVEINAKLMKHETKTKPHPYRMWAPVPMMRTHGVVVGKRVLANNYVHHDPYAMPAAKETDKVSAYLIAYDMRKAPIYVLPEHMKRTP